MTLATKLTLLPTQFLLTAFAIGEIKTTLATPSRSRFIKHWGANAVKQDSNQ